MSSEAETQQAPQPAADAESPSSPAAAASAVDKKVIGKADWIQLALLACVGFVEQRSIKILKDYM